MERRGNQPELPGKRFEIAGHILHVLHAPDDRLEALLQLIAAARNSIVLSMYMFHNDTSGTEVRDALVQAAARGVQGRSAGRQLWFVQCASVISFNQSQMLAGNIILQLALAAFLLDPQPSEAFDC